MRHEPPMSTCARIDAYWARFLGVPASVLERPGVVVVPHAALRDYHGVWFFVHGTTVVISAPPPWIARLERAYPSVSPAELLSPETARAGLGGAAGQVVGPSFQGWLSKERFCPVATAGVQRVTADVAGLVTSLRRSCPAREWAHGALDAEAGEVWASFEGDEVAALGQLRGHEDGAVDPCVITHPQHRQRGHARRLVSAMAQHGLEGGQLVLFQTLLSNLPAVSVALRLGFERYAAVLAVRLSPAAGAPVP